MSEKRVKLGDVVDDYCPRCRLLLNHSVMAVVEPEIKKVRCNTCAAEHSFRHGTPPKRRKDPLKEAYEALLAKLPKH
jgi:hypothetical protein